MEESEIENIKQWELVNFCEFDPYASKSYCAIHNTDEKMNLGDITKINEKEISDFNMIVGGSPCQDFSVAGKQAGAEWKCIECNHKYNPLEAHYTKRDKCPKCNSTNIVKTRSSLLVEWLRVLREKKPDFGIYENVKNIIGKQFKATFELFTDELNEYGYNTHYKVLNAKNYGVPQNRERVYLIIIKKELDNGKFEFPKPFDNGVRLKNVLEKEVDEKFYISQDKVNQLLINLNNKIDIDAQVIGTCHVKNDLSFATRDRVYSENCDSPTLTATMYKDAPKIMCNIIGKLNSSQDGVVVSPDGIAPTHTAGHGNCPKVIQVGNIVDTGNWRNPQRGRIYSSDGCSPALNCCGGGGLEPKIIQGAIRGRYVDSGNIEQQLEIGSDDCINTITTVQKDNVVIEEKTVIGVIDPQGRKNEMCFQKYIKAIIQCFDILNKLENEGMGNKKRYKDCRKVLLVLWDEIRKETIQWKARGFWSIQEKNILQSSLYGELQDIAAKSRCNMENSSPHSTADKRKDSKNSTVSNLWEEWAVRRSSYKLELEGQLITEFTSFVSHLSQQNTQDKKCMLDMWATNERIGVLQQALHEIQKIGLSFDEKEKCRMSELQSNNRQTEEMFRIRKLTPRETWRLMGFNDEQFSKAEMVVSNSQLYKQAGNSIVVNVLFYILVELYKAMPYLFDEIKLSSFFSGIGAFECSLDLLFDCINSGTIENFTQPQVE